MEIVFIWLLLGFASAILANAKGRSGCAWFLMGVLLGPLGFLMIGFMPKIEDISRNSNNVTRICPFCAEEVLVAAKVCKHCKNDLPRAPRDIFCPDCGADITYMPEECPKCGRKFVYKNKKKQ